MIEIPDNLLNPFCLKNGQKAFVFDTVDAATAIEMLDRSNPASPWVNYIGNDKAVYRLHSMLAVALGDKYHRCPQKIALLGPASVGKTTLAKLVAQTLGLPIVAIQPQSVKTAQDILVKISEACSAATFQQDGNTYSLELEKVEGTKNKIVLPPVVVFIDEVHALSQTLVDSLLTATEANDGIMDTGKWIVDCKNVCWIIATTERGKLFHPFESRFKSIQLTLYSKAELSEMVKLKYPNWDKSVCDLIAHYGGRIPRRIYAFAEDVEIEGKINPGDWKEIIERVARENEMDKNGRTKQETDVIEKLKSDSVVSAANLAAAVHVQEEELVNYILPSLMVATSDQPAFVRSTPRGYALIDQKI